MNTSPLKGIIWRIGASLPYRPQIKQAALASYVHVARPLPRVLLGLANQQRVVALVYHRVNNEHQDAVTVSVQQFEQQMSFIRANYPVASIEDVIQGRAPRGSLRPVIAITFDDGYLDNFTNAAPILQRLHIPAAFFVCTRFVGTTEPLPHDRRRLNKAVPLMNWDHLRELSARGFTIGSHTASHIDCALRTQAEVRGELEESRDTLRKELGIEKLLFAYPYGGKHNITPEALAEVRRAGYVGCLSAYGGCNQGTIDPFNIVRAGVDNKFDMLAFQARLEGYQLVESYATT